MGPKRAYVEGGVGTGAAGEGEGWTGATEVDVMTAADDEGLTGAAELDAGAGATDDEGRTGAADEEEGAGAGAAPPPPPPYTAGPGATKVVSLPA